MYVMNRGKQGRHSPGAGWETWNLTPPPASPTASTASSPTTVASVTYTFALQGDPNYLHFITINGVTYSIAENGYSAAQIPLVLSLLAASDANCAVTYPGTGPYAHHRADHSFHPDARFGVGRQRVREPRKRRHHQPAQRHISVLHHLSERGPDARIESESRVARRDDVTHRADHRTVTIPLADAPTDPRVGSINIYRTGGTQGSAYLVGNVPSTIASPATVFNDSMSDLQATNNGVVMPTQNDPPPAASGMIGPFFSMLLAWSTKANKNRLFWTPVDQPQYWPGSADPQVGNWVDVGDDEEEIVWCSLHTNLVGIYKERSIWILIGSNLSTATLECVYDGIGLAGQWALAPAGQIDYFVGPNGLYLFDMAQVHILSGNILPLFNQDITNAGSRTPPGSILPGIAFNSASTAPYAVALGDALGRLNFRFAEQGGTFCLMVFDEGTEPERNAFLAQQRSGRWFYHRNVIADTVGGFFGFYFDGESMIGLTGQYPGGALGYSLSDFRQFNTFDPGPIHIESVYRSHFEDCGLPDNDKVWLEVAIDCEIDEGIAGGGADVYAYFNNGNINYPTFLGFLTVGPRQTVSFPLRLPGVPGSQDDGFLARNCAIEIYLNTTGAVTLHNVYLYYYVEARVAVAASTLPTDLGVGKVKECKELELDINPTAPVTVQISSDLPGNVLAVRESPVATAAGRALKKFPFPQQQGYLWQIALAGGPFRLYSARLLMRVLGTYIEAYESAAGFVWDSQETTLGTDAIKQGREISLEIDTYGGTVMVALLTDLPGNAQAVRFSAPVSNAGGRGFIRIPLPQGYGVAPIEGRYYRVQLSGGSTFALYGISIEFLPIGVYIEAYEGAGGAVYDSRELDFGTPKVKEARELEIDIDTVGPQTVTLYSDLPPAQPSGLPPTWSGSPGPTVLIATATLSTLGRQTVRIPTTFNANLEQFMAGRQFRLNIAGPNAYKLYGARIQLREYGQFITADENAGGGEWNGITLGGALWDSTPLDLGMGQRVKAVKRIEVDLVTYSNNVTVSVLASQEGDQMGVVTYAYPLATNGLRRPLTVPMPPGVRGRLIQLQINGTACALYAVRVWWRPLNDPKAEWQWTEMPIVATQPAWAWAPFPVIATDAQWGWGKVVSVEETENTWQWVEVPFGVTETQATGAT